MVRCIGAEFKKYCYLPYMLTGVLGIVFLGFVNTVYDSEGMQVPVFILMLRYLEGKVFGDISMCGWVLWGNVISGWLAVFAPLLLTFSYIAVLSGERQDGLTQFELIRFGNLKYSITKVASGALFAGMVFVLAYIVLGLLFAVAFPPLSDFSREEQEIFWGGYPAVYVLKKLAGGFVYGTFSGMFGIGVAVWFRDKYMLICLPFLLNYVYQQILLKAATARYASGAESAEWLEAFLPYRVADISMSRYWIVPMAVMIFVYAVIIVSFCLNIKRGNRGV